MSDSSRLDLLARIAAAQPLIDSPLQPVVNSGTAMQLRRAKRKRRQDEVSTSDTPSASTASSTLAAMPAATVRAAEQPVRTRRTPTRRVVELARARTHQRLTLKALCVR